MGESEGHTYLVVGELFVDVNTGSEKEEKRRGDCEEE
jgi:hypothetical protein